MANIVGTPSSMQHDCVRCGATHPNHLEANVCCLFAPPPLGWCAWCGEDVPKKQVYCNRTCAVSYERDL